MPSRRVRFALTTTLALLILSAGFVAAPHTFRNLPPTPNTPDASPHPWRQRFEQLYRLEPNEHARLIPPPFSPDRRLFTAADWRDNRPDVDQFQMSFNFYPERGLRRENFAADPGTLDSAVTCCAGHATLISIPLELRSLPVPGDWVVDRHAPLERRLAACQHILRARTGRKIVIEKSNQNFWSVREQ